MEEYFLYNLDNEEENKFLFAVDLENANVIDKVETVTVEKTDRSIEVNKHRFVNYSAHPSGYQLKAYSDILSSALNERPQPSPGPAISKSSESPLAEVRKIPSSFSNSSRKQ